MRCGCEQPARYALRKRNPVVWIDRLFLRDNDYGERWFDNWDLLEQLVPKPNAAGSQAARFSKLFE